MKRLCLILGDQLSHSLSSLRSLGPEDEVMMAEVYSEATYVKHHPQKIALIFSAMRHFARELIDQGIKVHYYTIDHAENRQSLPAQMTALSRLLNCRHWVITEPGEWRLKEALLSLGCGDDPMKIELLEDDRFIVSHAQFREFLKGRKQPRMEHFYRIVRRETGYLMEEDGKPLGGQWNYDSQNRKAYHGGATPERILFHPDELTLEVINLVQNRFSEHFGDLDSFNWPVKRDQALVCLSHFIEERLSSFGDFQDALVKGEDTLFHSLLSSSINIGLLSPLEVCDAAIEAFKRGAAPLNAVEGFIRQIIGWREYVRGLYWAYMPHYAQLNELNADQELPQFYWDESLTSMHCMSEAIRNTRENGYAHHIQRLMITGNFALMYGSRIQEVTDWYLAVYVDAFEWVELPNTLGMALFADGGIMASKPYCSSGKYIDRMSNYCKECAYSVKESSGDQACPFNILYWDFLIRHLDRFSSNPRMALTMKHVHKMSDERRLQIEQEAKNMRQRIRVTGSERPSELMRERGDTLGEQKSLF